MEEFKIIHGFPDYEVSNFGRVRTLARKIRYIHAVTRQEHFRFSECRFLKEHINPRTNYKFYQLYRDKKMYNKPVHRLVAETFLPLIDGLDYVNHIDGNKHNNTVDNLEWCTLEYNHYHATITGLKPKGERIGGSKLNDLCVSAIKKMCKDGISHKQIAKWFDISRSSVSIINVNKSWKHISI